MCSSDLLVRLSLWSRDKDGEPQGVIGHETALRLYELSDLMPGQYHLSVPKGFRKIPPPGVVLHKANLELEDWGWRTGYRITTALRTLIDLALDHLIPEHLETATRQALERGLVRRKKLEASLASLPASAKATLTRALHKASESSPREAEQP